VRVEKPGGSALDEVLQANKTLGPPSPPSQYALGMVIEALRGEVDRGPARFLLEVETDALVRITSRMQDDSLPLLPFLDLIRDFPPIKRERPAFPRLDLNRSVRHPARGPADHGRRILERRKHFRPRGFDEDGE